MILAAKEGLLDENSLEKSKELYVNVNIFNPEHKNILAKLHALPSSCFDSAVELKNDRKIYEENGVFPSGIIDEVIEKLQSYNDKNLSEELFGNKDEIKKLVDKYLHCM
jgi:glutamine synthetase